MDESDDELVVQVMRTRSREAYGELVRRHQAALRSTLVRLTKDPMVADDLAQDTLIRAYQRIDQYVLGKSFRAWLGGIAYHEFLKTMRRWRASQRNLDRLAAELNDSCESQNANPDTIDLDRALKKLRIEERTAIVLSYGFGMSHAEVSRAMEAPVGTVKSWVNRGSAKVRESLEINSDSNIDA